MPARPSERTARPYLSRLQGARWAGPQRRECFMSNELVSKIAQLLSVNSSQGLAQIQIITTLLSRDLAMTLARRARRDEGDLDYYVDLVKSELPERRWPELVVLPPKYEERRWSPSMPGSTYADEQAAKQAAKRAAKRQKPKS